MNQFLINNILKRVTSEMVTQMNIETCYGKVDLSKYCIASPGRPRLF